MAIIEEMLAEETVVGTGLGVGAALLAAPLLGRVLRPAAKAVIKGGIVLYRGAADVMTEAAAATAPGSTTAERAHAETSHAGSHPARAGGRRAEKRSRSAARTARSAAGKKK